MKVPSLEIRLDSPAALTSPRVLTSGRAAADSWARGTVALSRQPPESLREDLPLWMMRPGGNSAILYRAFREMVRVLDSVRLPKEFAWSSMLLVPVCDDEELTSRREETLYRAGAVTHVWLRCPTTRPSKPPCGLFPPADGSRCRIWPPPTPGPWANWMKPP